MRIMDWKITNLLPWKILLLFGGGFALAKGFITSGLSLIIGEMIKNIMFDNLLLNILMVTSVMVFLTEITSNTATTQIILPVLAGLAMSTGINPLLLMIPATIGASMAFMLPVATPPNAIVFGSGRIKMKDMARFGLILNIISIILITVFIYFIRDNINFLN